MGQLLGRHYTGPPHRDGGGPERSGCSGVAQDHRARQHPARRVGCTALTAQRHGIGVQFRASLDTAMG
jgi:hypothetical protein